MTFPTQANVECEERVMVQIMEAGFKEKETEIKQHITQVIKESTHCYSVMT